MVINLGARFRLASRSYRGRLSSTSCERLGDVVVPRCGESAPASHLGGMDQWASGRMQYISGAILVRDVQAFRSDDVVYASFVITTKSGS